MNITLDTKQESRISFAIRIALLFLTLLTAIPLMNNYLRDIYKIFCVVCTLWSVYYVWKHKLYKKTMCILSLAFLISYTVTILIVRRHVVNELAMVGYTIILLSLLIVPVRVSRRCVEKEVRILSLLVFYFSAITAFLSTVMFLFSVEKLIVIGGTEYVIGMYQNRLWGLWNPNTGAPLYLIGALCGLLLFRRDTGRKIRIIYMSGIVFDLFAFVLCQSRGGWVMMITFILCFFVFAFRGGISLIDVWRFRKLVCKRALYGVIVSVFLIGCGYIIRDTAAYIPSAISAVTDVDGSKRAEHEKNLRRIEEREGNLNSVTTGRSNLWKAGLQAYKTSPVFGIGYRSVDDVIRKISKAVYLNSHMGGLHNIYLTVLVSSGMVGLILFITLVLYSFVKSSFRLLTHGGAAAPKLLCLFVFSVLVGELAESRIFFGLNFIAILFWSALGYIIYFSSISAKRVREEMEK